MPGPYRRYLIICLIALLCASSLWLAYKWFQDRYLHTFDPHVTLFTGDSLRLPTELAGPGPIRVVHFWDPACPCNVGNQQHLAELVEHFEPRGVAFYAVRSKNHDSELPTSLKSLQILTNLPGSDDIPATPAVAIWDQAGRLAYFGPYSEGLTCNAANSFIDPILEALIEHRSLKATHTLASGCYCRWEAAHETLR